MECSGEVTNAVVSVFAPVVKAMLMGLVSSCWVEAVGHPKEEMVESGCWVRDIRLISKWK